MTQKDTTLLDAAAEAYGGLEVAAKILGVKVSTWTRWAEGKEPVPMHVRRSLRAALARSG